jgi:hypothetical protein
VLKVKAYIIAFKEPFKTPIKSPKKAVIIKEVKYYKHNKFIRTIGLGSIIIASKIQGI